MIRLGPAAVVDLDHQVQQAMRHGLPLPAEEMTLAHWESPNGTVRAWSVANDQSEPDALLTVDDATGTATMTSGYARGSFPRTGAALLDGRDELNHLGGLWALVAAREGAVVGACSWAGAEPLYYTRTSDGALWLGNRPAWVHFAATGRATPDVDPVGVTGLLCTGSSTTRRTPYAGLTQLGPGAIIEGVLEGDHVRVIRRDRPRPPRDTQANPDALAEALTRAVADLPLPPDGVLSFGLTGGRDSRLLAATLLNAGYDLSVFTNGQETSGDVLLAAQIAAHLGVRHERREREGIRETSAGSGRTRVNPERRIFHNIVLGDGMYTAYDATGRFPPQFHAERAALSGSGGEILRGGHAKRHDPKNRRDGAHWLIRGSILSQKRIVRPEVWAEYRQSVQHWVDWAREDPREALFENYLQQRAGQWLAGSRLGTSLSALPRTVLIDDDVVWAVLQAPIQALCDESLIAGAMEAMYPGLTQIPFLGTRLGFDTDPGKSSPRRQDWLARTPLTQAAGISSYNWRLDYAQGIGEVVTRSVEQDTSGVFTDNAATILAPADRELKAYEGIRGWHAVTVGQLSNPRWWDPKQRFIPPSESVEFALPEATPGRPLEPTRPSGRSASVIAKTRRVLRRVRYGR